MHYVDLSADPVVSPSTTPDLVTMVTVPSSPSSLSEFAVGCVRAHNVARRLHEDTSDLTWDEDLAAQAQDYLDSTVTDGDVPHSCPPNENCNYGENIFTAGGLDATTPIPCGFAAFFWYRESVWENYDYEQPFYAQSGTVGHFTQLVWKDTSVVGCARAQAQDSWFILCQYRGPGNIAGNRQFSLDNVLPLRRNVQAPEQPQDLMDNCADLYAGPCDNLRGQCSTEWSRDFGPATFCPFTCNRC